MSLIPISPATFQCTFSKVATKSEAKKSARHDALLRARRGRDAAGGEGGGGHATAPEHVGELLDALAAREPLAPLGRERRAVEAPRLPARGAGRAARRGCASTSSGGDDDARARVAHELGRGAVGRDDGEDRPLRREVLEDLPGQDALAAAAGLRDQQQQRLGVALQLERAAARDVAEQLDAVAEAELLHELAIGSRERRRRSARRRLRGPTSASARRNGFGSRLPWKWPACVIRSRSLGWCSRPAKSSKSQPFSIVTTLPFGSSARISSAIASDAATIASACDATSRPTPPTDFSFSRESCDS